MGMHPKEKEFYESQINGLKKKISALQETLEEKDDVLAVLKGETEAASKEVRALKGERDELRETKAALEEQVKVLEEKVARLEEVEAELKEKRESINRLTNENTKLGTQVETYREELKEKKS
ncbi:MAG: hypothetical protein GXO65_03590, partial [Euryarchaeota archaeon]|nr:hypothetical protein [Euryarchaeota archaeon]